MFKNASNLLNLNKRNKKTWAVNFYENTCAGDT